MPGNGALADVCGRIPVSIPVRKAKRFEKPILFGVAGRQNVSVVSKDREAPFMIDLKFGRALDSIRTLYPDNIVLSVGKDLFVEARREKGLDRPQQSLRQKDGFIVIFDDKLEPASQDV